MFPVVVRALTILTLKPAGQKIYLMAYWLWVKRFKEEFTRLSWWLLPSLDKEGSTEKAAALPAEPAGNLSTRNPGFVEPKHKAVPHPQPASDNTEECSVLERPSKTEVKT